MKVKEKAGHYSEGKSLPSIFKSIQCRSKSERLKNRSFYPLLFKYSLISKKLGERIKGTVSPIKRFAKSKGEIYKNNQNLKTSLVFNNMKRTELEKTASFPDKTTDLYKTILD